MHATRTSQFSRREGGASPGGARGLDSHRSCSASEGHFRGCAGLLIPHKLADADGAARVAHTPLEARRGAGRSSNPCPCGQRSGNPTPCGSSRARSSEVDGSLVTRIATAAELRTKLAPRGNELASGITLQVLAGTPRLLRTSRAPILHAPSTTSEIHARFPYGIAHRPTVAPRIAAEYLGDFHARQLQYNPRSLDVATGTCVQHRAGMHTSPRRFPHNKSTPKGNLHLMRSHRQQHQSAMRER